LTAAREVDVGTIEKDGGKYVFRQDNGEITARFDSIEEKRVLAHEGRPFYKRLFILLVAAGVLYLALIFFLM
jgi:hypothetical protein